MNKNFYNINLYRWLLLILLLAGCKHTEVTPVKSTDLVPLEEHLLLGNPSNANADPVNTDNLLLQKSQYTVSFSQDRGIPNWVSWHLTKDWIGEADRQDDFRVDNTLPADWYRVSPTSYTGSGFDRGHNCPSADRTKTIEDNSATFLMTNMIPQAPDNNRETWANLEEYTRDLVRDGNEVYVIMGNYGISGIGTNGPAQTIDQGRITVPNQIWKVVVVLPEGEDDITRVSATTRIIAVDTPNQNGINSNWGLYRTSVDAIEQVTGYNLLSSLPEQVQQVVESKVDNGPTQ